MILFPKLPKRAANALMTPIHILHRSWWKLGSMLRKTETSQERYRWLVTARSLTFVVGKKIGSDKVKIV
jgi:hypothetical protein